MKLKEILELADFSEGARKELEEKKRKFEKKLREHSQIADDCRILIEHFNALLGVTKRGQNKEEKSGSALTPTKFVKKLLEDSPDRWISIQEFLFQGRSAIESGEVKINSGSIENSIHSVLTRFRTNRQVQTKGKRDSRKYKLKT